MSRTVLLLASMALALLLVSGVALAAVLVVAPTKEPVRTAAVEPVPAAATMEPMPAASTEPVEAQTQVENGKIAFIGSGDSYGSYNLYIMNADGSGAARLTTTETAAEPDLAWSPRGKKLAFSRNRDNNRDIYVINAHGSDITRLTRNPADDAHPAWSPDGSKIAFLGAYEGIYYVDGVYAVDSDGSDFTLPNQKYNDFRSIDWQPLSYAPPRVVQVQPTPDARGIPRGANIKATFSEAMRNDPPGTRGDSTINRRTFKLYKKGSTTPLRATVSYNHKTYKATLDPKNELRADTTYKAVVTTEAKDLAGNRLDQNRAEPGRQNIPERPT